MQQAWLHEYNSAANTKFENKFKLKLNSADVKYISDFNKINVFGWGNSSRGVSSTSLFSSLELVASIFEKNGFSMLPI